MHCLVGGRRRKDREMLQMLRRLEVDLMRISPWSPRCFYRLISSRARAVYGGSECRHHLRDEAGSLLAFELGGAEELTVISGGTAMAALVRGQSHTSSKTMSSSRDSDSCKQFSTQISCVCGDTSPSLAVTVDWNLRAPLATLRDSTWAEPRKRRRRCAPPSTHTTCHHQLNPNTYITHTFLSLADTPYRDKQYEIDNYLASTITPFFRGIGLLSIYTSAFVHCPLFDGFLAAGSVDSLGSRQLPCYTIATSPTETGYLDSDSTLKLKLRLGLGLGTRPSLPQLLTTTV
jgi:hypothetical protein